MKRLAILLMLTAFLGSPVRLAAADLPLPLPTGMAPTSPQVPAPVLVEGLPAAQGADWSRTSFRDRLGVGATHAAPAEVKPAGGPRLTNRVMSWMQVGHKSESAEVHASWIAKPQWCENCAPAVRHPLPPLPGNLSTSHTHTITSPGCTSAAGCAPAPESGSCCKKLKDWLCYRQTPVRFPLVPTAKDPATYTYFPTVERPGVCANGSCATGNCANAAGKPVRGVAGCVPCPAPGETILPGYRLANPEHAAVPAIGPVVNSSYKTPINR